ncbi:trypsin-like peptidase domain-containing protein [Sphingomonas canadensis]|uniref:Trypsin-like peptidase domain-containing protein n=1 Tax=Sphingomonas canadensis TaxID=1219257 RepID=A0ABW3H7Z9_9SPHN|nr:serine protease [Sphingomonas canadensis]
MIRIVIAIAAGLIVGPAPGQAQTVPAPPAPPAPEQAAASVCRPRFLVDGKPLEAGTGFVVLPGAAGAKPLLVTAIHLFGPSGGLAAEVPWAQMALRARLDLCVPQSGGRVPWHGGAALVVPGARPMGTLPYRDMAAFVIDSGAPALTLAPAPPRAGEKVWLIAPLAGRPDGPLLHRATVAYAGIEALQYVFDDPRLPLRATSGGPVVNAAGQVVGVHLGGGIDKGELIGMATGLQVLTNALRDAR